MHHPPQCFQSVTGTADSRRPMQIIPSPPPSAPPASGRLLTHSDVSGTFPLTSNLWTSLLSGQVRGASRGWTASSLARKRGGRDAGVCLSSSPRLPPFGLLRRRWGCLAYVMFPPLYTSLWLSSATATAAAAQIDGAYATEQTALLRGCSLGAAPVPGVHTRSGFNNS